MPPFYGTLVCLYSIYVSLDLIVPTTQSLGVFIHAEESYYGGTDILFIYTSGQVDRIYFTLVYWRKVLTGLNNTGIIINLGMCLGGALQAYRSIHPDAINSIVVLQLAATF